MLVDVGLDEQGVLLGIQATGNILCQLLQGSAPQVGRCLSNSNGMQVSHKVEALIQVAPGTPVLDGTQVVAQMQVSGGLDAGEHPLLGYSSFSNHITHGKSRSFFVII